MLPLMAILGPGSLCIVSKVFVDTNLLVYAIDQRDLDKQAKARIILKKITDEGRVVISTQVAQEFYVVATTKLRADRFFIKNIVHSFRNFETVYPDLDLIEAAIDISMLFQLSFWDSMIVAAAEKAKCGFIFSEDLNAGQTYRGITVINPFLDTEPLSLGLT